ncbi:hypothetical protein ACNPQK_21215 [Acinetobacter guillouiae]|uniref:Uncharacterized protein n=1 Tax=Acinetobacter guillouiae NIPH 991 TaxID=1217656 RepID=N8Y853_ACIGI|nr:MULTISPECIES: hypothetical protein [Acinetobacter]ENV15500.1 hypothetical protein F964_04226 [Acinetobacter guillouiae NIPH 991]UOH17553.1 hypothetical protein MTO68_17250 [Acinetobacter sp. NyZ410]
MATQNPIPVYFNPEIGPNYQGLSFEDIANSFNNGQQFSNQIQQQQQKGILARLIAQNTGADGQVDLNKSLQSVQTNPNHRYQPEIVNTLSGMIQQQNAAKLKSQNDALTLDADLNKKYAETGKLKQEGLGKGLENSEKKLGAINQIFQAAALTGSKNNVLLGLNGALKSGVIDPDTFNQQKQIVDLMSPEDIKSYASGISFGNAKDPASILYQTANNAADNATSSANNMRTTNASIYSTDIGAQTADKNRVQQDSQFQQNYTLNQQKAFFEQNKPTSYGYDTQGRQYAVLPNGKAVYVKDEQGQYVVGQQKGGKGLSEQQSKDALFGARMQESNAILNELESKGISQTVMSRLPWLGDSLSTSLPSVLGGANESQGKYMQARRDFINAVLRKESGAVIADSEFSNAEKQYFPQVGDSKEIIAQKARNRDLATKMILGSAGPVGQQLVNQVRGKEGASTTQPPLINSSSFMP